MNNLFFSIGIIFLCSLCFSSCQNSYNQNDNQIGSLSDKYKVEFKKKLIRFIGKMPESANNKTKFHPYFDQHYQQQIALYSMEYYLKDVSGKEFFLFTKVAPSIKKKKIAVGGWVQISADGTITDMKEVFNTWKQEIKELNETSELLFFKMVNGESLEEYSVKNSNQLGLIQFPSSDVFYDQESRMWLSKHINILDQFYNQKIIQTQQELDSLATSIK